MLSAPLERHVASTVLVVLTAAAFTGCGNDEFSSATPDPSPDTTLPNGASAVVLTVESQAVVQVVTWLAAASSSTPRSATPVSATSR